VKAVELAKTYDPKDFEDRIYTKWKEGGYFKPNLDNSPSYTIVMPPPNVTGILHMGHALNNTLQDILIRYERMRGKSALWLPGTDHAGIATQNVVERELNKENLTRQDLGREKFVERTWLVKERHHEIIKKQLEKIGSSCDWSRERFTLDEGLSDAVREAFVRLYEKGLIYKGNYLVNYCPHCGTALSDDEVEHVAVEGKLYQIKYPAKDNSFSLTVATTRPETMFGDTAVAVNPEDDRYNHLIGKKVILPLTDKEIVIIGDSYVDMEFGTGALKVTPAHDPNDWEIGQRHSLEAVNILNEDGTLNENVPSSYQGKEITSSRKFVVEDLKEQGYLLDEKKHDHDVGTCYRCSTLIEPYLSQQWFVAMDGMAQKALKAWEEGKINFYAKRWENTYTHWLKNIRPWCISRQLWWGHRIPVWYCNECDNVMVERTDPTYCSKCNSTNIYQEEDVLDTWFSSWLWPFSTLGWPSETEDLKKFFPTNTLVTGYDIIFFWVSRMIMASLELVGEVPFNDIYITGLVRDKSGRKMSKSLGNGIDPLDVVDQYGADAMKFTLSYMAAQGQDILVDFDSFKFGSRFANKIWNASRFLLMNLEGRNLVEIESNRLTDLDKWMYHSLNEAALKIEKAIASFRFNDASTTIYDLFWNDFCDWYIEATKAQLKNFDDKQKDHQVSVMMHLLGELMKLMHPFVSFITEEIYQNLPSTTSMIIDQSYPTYSSDRVWDKESSIVNSMQSFVKSVRTLRSELQIPPERKIEVVFRPEATFSAKEFVIENNALISSFIGSNELVVDLDGSKDVNEAIPVGSVGFEAFVFVKDAIDVVFEIDKVTKELAKAEKSLKQTLNKLANEKFINNAKQEAIDKEHKKRAEFVSVIEKSKKHLQLLSSLAK
jgi:valyl-tRNA synthetase